MLILLVIILSQTQPWVVGARASNLLTAIFDVKLSKLSNNA